MSNVYIKINDVMSDLAAVGISKDQTNTFDKYRFRGIDDVYDALQKYDALPVAGVTVIDCRFDGSTEFADPDGVTQHQVGTYRITYRFAE